MIWNVVEFSLCFWNVVEFSLMFNSLAACSNKGPSEEDPRGDK
jgi:predicted small lipoprotein YifL